MSFYNHANQAAFFNGAAKRLVDFGEADRAIDAQARSDFQALLANREQTGNYFTSTFGDLVDALHSLPDNAQGYGWRHYSNNTGNAATRAKQPHLQVMLAFTTLSRDRFQNEVALPLLQGKTGYPVGIQVADERMRAVFFGVASRKDAAVAKPGELELYTSIRTARVENGVLTFKTEGDISGRNWVHELEGRASHERLGGFIGTASPRLLGQLENALNYGRFPRCDYALAN